MRTTLSGVGLLARVLFFFTLVGSLLLFPRVAAAFTPPSPQGAVTDTSGHLSADDDRLLEARIAAYRARTTNEIAVLMVGSLGGENVDDVAYTTFNTWGVGKKGTDNGVLLVIAPTERKMRIETGKGIGDKLTDLQSSRILRERVGPMLKENRFRDAVVAGLDGIEAALGAEPAPATPRAHPAPPPAKADVGEWVFGIFLFVVVGTVVGLLLVIFVKSPRARRRGEWQSSGDSSSSSDSYVSSSSTSDWGGSSSSGSSDYGGSSGGSDFGGGSSGGGGSSDSY